MVVSISVFAVVVTTALFATDGAEFFFEKACRLLAAFPGEADGIDGDASFRVDPYDDLFFRFHDEGSGGEGEFDGSVGLLFSGDSEPLLVGFPDGLVDAVELDETAVVGTDFLLDVTGEPVGGQFVAVIFISAIGGDVVGTFELDDEFALAGLIGESACLGIPEKFQAEFGTGVFESRDIADLGLNGGEV